MKYVFSNVKQGRFIKANSPAIRVGVILLISKTLLSLAALRCALIHKLHKNKMKPQNELIALLSVLSLGRIILSLV